MSLNFRLHRDEDLPELQSLWLDNTDWGGLTPDLWRKHIIEAPLGGASILVATDSKSGRIVGEFAFMPSRVRVKGREVSAFRPAAPIVARGYRFFGVNPLNHPAIAMYTNAVEALRDRGEGLVYMVPDPRWTRLIQMFPNLIVGSFPLFSRPLPLSSPMAMDAGYDAGPVELTDSRVDELWQKSAAIHGTSIVRDTRSLPWKIGKGEDHVLGLERGGELVGIVACRQKGDRQWLVTDLLFADAEASLRNLLIAAANLGHEHALSTTEKPIAKVAVLATSPMHATVKCLGFARDRYDFPLVVQVLDQTIDKRDVATEQWFVSAND